MPLTDVKIRKGKPRPKSYNVSDGGGLSSPIRPGGGRLWQQKYRFLGKERVLSLGQYPAVILAQARKKRDEAHAMLAHAHVNLPQLRDNPIGLVSLVRHFWSSVGQP